MPEAVNDPASNGGTLIRIAEPACNPPFVASPRGIGMFELPRRRPGSVRATEAARLPLWLQERRTPADVASFTSAQGYN